MDVAQAVVVGVLVGLIAGVGGCGLVVGATRRRPGARDRSPSSTEVEGGREVPTGIDAPAGLVRTSLDGLRSGVIVLNQANDVVLANPAALAMKLVKADESQLAHAVLRSLVAQVRRSGERRDVDLDLPRGASRNPLGARVRVTLLDDGYVSLEIEDVTELHRVNQVRKDFVANVSHELKTPVGALQLLSEALLDAVDDPEAARRFTERIQHESARLSRLVTELIELSRLQGGDPLPAPEPVRVDRMINEVLDRSRTAAAAKEIDIFWSGDRGLMVYGHEGQLVTALANLVENAIAYSPERTSITITTGRSGKRVLVSVTDEGIGIAEADIDRIFERFYRADPARSRATGGTGLGLAIVKHIATNHGGRVEVRSTVGDGSTFTLRLPARPPGVTPSMGTSDPMAESSTRGQQ